MRIAEGLVELVAHTRWLCSHALSFIALDVQQQYKDDFEVAKSALAELSRPMAHVERLQEVPADTFRALCDGVIYLLVAEAIVGEAPATMHQFLRQATLSQSKDPQQAQLLCVRWLCNIGVVSLAELEAIVFGAHTSGPGSHSAADTNSVGAPLSDAECTPLTERYPSAAGTPPRFESSLELQSAIAERLASPEPFYLGAHITLLRGLINRYTEEITSIEDIMAHVDVVTCPPPSLAMEEVTAQQQQQQQHGQGIDTSTQSAYQPVIRDPKVVDDALLAWIHAVLSLASTGGGSTANPTPKSALGGPVAGGRPATGSGAAAQLIDVTAMEDLYLHTNDGRALALLVSYYRPDLLPSANVHMLHPLTVWQRQDNWSSVIQAAEALDLWVGVFPAEFVAHGFAALQHHVLRFCAELFVMLASDAEQRFSEIAQDLELELDADTTFVNVTTRESRQGLPNALRRSQLQLRGSYAGVTGANDTSGAADVHATPNRPTPVSVFENVRTRAVEDPTFPAKGTPAAENVHASLDAADTNSSASPIHPAFLPGSGVGTSVRTSFAGSRHAPPNASAAMSEGVSTMRTTDQEDSNGSRPPSSPSGGSPSAAGGAREGDYSVVLTSLVLNGIAMPIRRAEQQQASSPSPAPHQQRQPVDVAESVVVTELPKEPQQQRDAHDESLASVGAVAPPATADSPPRSKSPEAPKGRRQSSAANSLNSPVGGRGRASDSAVRASFADPRTGRAAAVPTNPLVRSVAHFRAQRPETRLPGAGALTRSVAPVQGSRDTEGIEALLAELASLKEPAPEARPPKWVDEDDLKAQNLHLRNALDQQRRQVAELVDRIRGGLRAHDFGVVVDHLRRHGPSKATEESKPTPPPQVPPQPMAPMMTPALNVLAQLAATEENDPAAYAALPSPPRPERPYVPKAAAPPPPAPEPVAAASPPAPAPQPAASQVPEQEQPQRRMDTLAALRSCAPPPRSGPPASAPASDAMQQPKASSSAQQQPPGTAPLAASGTQGQAAGSRATAFDIPLGSSVGVKGAAGPQLTGNQLQRLKERHAQRRREQQQQPPKPSRLPAIGSAGDTSTDAAAAEAAPTRRPQERAPAAARARSNSVPTSKSNRNNRALVVNALRHVCLPGAINKPQLDAAVQIVEGNSGDDAGDAAQHFVVLLKDEYNKQFKGLYQCRPGHECITRVFGAGPLSIRVQPDPATMGVGSSDGASTGDGATSSAAMATAAPGAVGLPPNQPSRFFKFDTGAKKFSPLPVAFFNQMTDAITLPPKLRNTRPPL